MTIKTIQAVGRQTLTERVYGMLLEGICSRELPPGQKLVIDALAREMGVSITPVREALRRLQREGLVTEIPYSGMHVSQLAINEIRELFAIRGVLEGYALRLITDTLTDKDFDLIDGELEQLEKVTRTGDTAAFRHHNFHFHSTLLRGDIGQALREMIDQLTRNTERYRAAGAVLSQDYLDSAQAEHRELVSLLKERRAVEAETLARQHALTFANHLMSHLERSHLENY